MKIDHFYLIYGAVFLDTQCLYLYFSQNQTLSPFLETFLIFLQSKTTFWAGSMLKIITLGEKEGLIILPKELKHDWPGAGADKNDDNDDNEDDDDDDDKDDDDDNGDYDVFYWYQRTSNTIGTIGGPINYDDDNDSDNDDDDDDDNNEDDNDDDDMFSKNIFCRIIIVEALSEWPEVFKSFCST